MPDHDQPQGANPQGGNGTSVGTGVGEQNATTIDNNFADVLHNYKSEVKGNNFNFFVGSDMFAALQHRGAWSEFGRFQAGFGSGPEDNTGAAPRELPKDMPDTYEALDEWLSDPTKLSQRELCMVYATAILHGVRAIDISVAREDIYAHLYPPDRKKRERERDPRPDMQVRPVDLFKNTFTKVKPVDGVQRVFWQDVDENGYSRFGLRVLRLIAEGRQGIAGIPEHDVLPMIEKWAADSNNSDLSLRAALALGVIWWCIDQNRLRETIETWAKDTNAQRRSAAAWMICGAYEIEQHEEQFPDMLGDGRQPVPMIARLLRQWSRDALQPNASAELANVVVMAYGRLGLVWPEVGLDGLDYLLGLTPGNLSKSVQIPPIAAFVLAIQFYVWLARVKHTRKVIARLATHVGHLVRNRKRGLDASIQSEQAWRTLGISNVYLIFFLIAAWSMDADNGRRSNTETDTAPHYGAEPTLLPLLSIPYAEKLDTLLVGILAPREDAFRGDVITLLTAALYNWNWNPNQVRQVLYTWAETLFRLPYSDGTEVARLQVRYRDFLVTLGGKAQELDADLAGHDPRITTESGYRAYEIQLKRQWPPRSNSYSLAQSALAQLAQRAAVPIIYPKGVI